jgi:tetratricopeptide (TPR) repeat protein
LEELLYLEAEAEFRHLIEVAVKLKQPYWIAEGYHWLGWSLERQQRAEEAVAAYEEAASFGVEHASTRHAMVDLARLNARLGRFDQSASLLDEAIRFEPHRRYFLIVAGDVYEMQGDCDKAIEYYRLASGIAPFDGQAWEKISKCYLRKGDPHQAIEAAQHGLDLNEKNAALHCLLASAYLQLESEDMACAHLREAMQLEPTNPECRAVLLNTRCEDYSGQTD